MIPEDVKNMYRKLQNTAFEKECDKRSYIRYCLETAKRLYGVVPFETFMKLVNTNGKKDFGTEEVRQILKEIPVEYGDIHQMK